MLKKCLGVLLVVCMLFTMTQPIMVAAADDGTLAVGSGSVAVGDADTVIPITVEKKGAVGIAVMQFDVVFPDALELTAKPVVGSLLADKGLHQEVYTSPYTISLGNDTATEDVTAEGVLITLNFKVKAGTAAGDYAITINAQDNYNANVDSVEFPVTAGKISVVEGAVETYVVTFETNGGSAVAAANVKSGDKVAKPADPTKEGNTFAGWFADAAFTTAFNFDTAITSNTTVYAKWEEAAVDTYVVTFNTNDGSAIDPVNVKSGDKVSQPLNPTKTGFTFKGWFTDSAATQKFDFNTPITANTTLYAGWDENGNSGNGGTGDGGCYIATSVYGSYDTPEVWTLRRFRDDVLGQTWYGRLFIKAYYAVSPTVVRLFGDADWFQNFWREKLDTLVQSLQDDGFESTPYQDKDW